MSGDLWDIYLEAFADLFRYNLTQPGLGVAQRPGIQARNRQWRTMEHGKTSKLAGNAGSALGGFTGGMMQVYLQERLSPINYTMATKHAWIWVPKALLHFRSHEWRYHAGQPYMWLMLPHRAQLSPETARTPVVLLLPNDPYRSKSSAVYAQRGLNRLVSEDAELFQKAKEAKLNPESKAEWLSKLLPHLGPFAIEASGIALAIFTSGA